MGWFLFFFGVFAGIVAAKFWEKKAHSLKKWHYLAGIILFFWTAYGTIFAYDSFVEGETRAAWFFIMVHWGMAIVISFLLIGIERKRPAKAAIKAARA